MRRRTLRKVQLVRGRPLTGKQESWLIRLDGVTSIEQAELLVGATLLGRPACEALLEDGEFYTPDLDSGQVVGKVVDLYSSGAHDLLQVQCADLVGKEEGKGRCIWIPFVEAIVPVVDGGRRVMEIIPPDGLLQLNSPAALDPETSLKQQESKDKRKRKSQMAAVRKRYTSAAQAHVLQGLSLGERSQQDSLLEELLSIDVQRLQQAASEATRGVRREGGTLARNAPVISWSDASCWHALEAESDTNATSACSQTGRLWKRGLGMIAQGQVAVVAIVGGQELGPSAPPLTGMLDLDLPGGKSLFQLQAEQLIRIQLLAKKMLCSADVRIPWLIMTTEATDATVRAFFLQNAHFGLNEEQVLFIRQGLVPCLAIHANATGVHPILMESPWKVAQTASGTGGVFDVLQHTHLLTKLDSMGVKAVQVYAVNNALVRVADPVYFGFFDEQGARVGLKSTRRELATEGAGLLILGKLKGEGLGDHQRAASEVGGRSNPSPSREAYQVVLCSQVAAEELDSGEASSEESAQGGESGFSPICDMIFKMDLLTMMRGSSGLPLRGARDSIGQTSRSNDGEWRPPELSNRANGIRLWQSVFDVLQMVPANQVAVLGVERSEEIALVNTPVGEQSHTRGVPGDDTPDHGSVNSPTIIASLQVGEQVSHHRPALHAAQHPAPGRLAKQLWVTL
eukprot:SM000030S11470  [mRNA]  locus=s30:906405:910531:+ [translate_table: standard]